MGEAVCPGERGGWLREGTVCCRVWGRIVSWGVTIKLNLSLYIESCCSQIMAEAAEAQKLQERARCEAILQLRASAASSAAAETACTGIPGGGGGRGGGKGGTSTVEGRAGGTMADAEVEYARMVVSSSGEGGDGSGSGRTSATLER